MVVELDPDMQHRIALFEATIAAYVLKDLNPDQRPEQTHEAAKATFWCSVISAEKSRSLQDGLC
jgi:hypothetical protein